MELRDVKTLKQVAKEADINHNTLYDRLVIKRREMIEGIDFVRLGKRQPILLSPEGIEKLLRDFKNL